MQGIFQRNIHGRVRMLVISVTSYLKIWIPLVIILGVGLWLNILLDFEFQFKPRLDDGDASASLEYRRSI